MSKYDLIFLFCKFIFFLVSEVLCGYRSMKGAALPKDRTTKLNTKVMSKN